MIKISNEGEKGVPLHRIKIFENTTAWKRHVDSIFTPKVCEDIWKSLVSGGFVSPPEADFMFVSPTANIATQEEEFFKLDTKTRIGKSTFIVSDAARLPIPQNRLRQRPDDNNENASQFIHVTRFAEDIFHNENIVDMFWDRKGYLWYSADKRDTRKFIEDLRQIHRILKPGGCVVIDNFNEDYSSEEDSGKYPHLGRQRLRYESSTAQIISELPQDENGYVWDQIQKLFECTAIGEGVTSVLVLRKNKDDVPAEGN